MALLIDKTVTVLGDIELPQLYLRLVVGYGPEGTPLDVQVKTYSSKTAYDANSTNMFEVDGILPYQNFAYDRATDGSDVLTFAHDQVKSVLSTDIIEDVPVLDPSTGEYTYDPSTGELITTPEITGHKFAQDSSISIVDL